MLNDSQILRRKPISINLDSFPGGVAAWGALPAVFDCHNNKFDRGVHVHARMTGSGKKIIDQSYPEVEIIWQEKNMILTEACALSYTMSSIFDFDIVSLNCSHCGTELLDENLASVLPSFEHYCAFCGGLTLTSKRCVANPVIRFKEVLHDKLVKRPSIMPQRKIMLDNTQYPGGFQIWGSNPSIIWTAKRLEESAIHVHAYNREKKRVIDNTYSEVWVNGILLDIEMVRILQIQKAIPELRFCLTSINCPSCSHAHFDKELLAVVPHQQHQCEQCDAVFTTPTSVISNPSTTILNQLTCFTGRILENGSICKNDL
ncbi:hypothetical protein [Fluoribacter gormanii]|uniref:Uncharacterized protein n=1 Tax=Fluoribacter gormanii TaxID=464 RepID=A0A377GKS4_9GAMM|nr:hypothetical protein [Fluoribacter gormanii]KTD01823.1 hypothetical protein Lgor_2200 [Fluoribacter gormanii]SIR21942.1 hypothetical protein SAMN05421777_10868 [Fluoribacter gormanii]STO25406.1 Uncharacterised protein [Fluoribacter gormanii]